MDESTEELARSQLEKLYTLGILERTSDDEENRSSKSENIGVNEHDTFLAALPPPSAMFPLTSRMLQSSADNLDSSQGPSSSRSGGFYDSTVSSHLLRRRQHRKPRRGSNLCSSSSLGSSSRLPVSPPVKRDRRVFRVWFRQWEIFIRYRRQKARKRGAAEFFRKQKLFTKWAAFLKQKRYEHDKKLRFDAWKVARAISRWAQWKQRCRRIGGLLSGGRSSFVGQVIQRRVWQRWIQFTKRRMYIGSILAQRTGCIHQRLMRLAWTEFRIHAFRARQDSLALRRCLKGLRDFHAIQERQRFMCVRYQQKVNRGRKRELLQRWRSFAYASGSNRRLAWRVQFDIRRRRYFLLWCEVARTVNHVEQLRSKIAFRELYQYFSVWKTTAKAIQIGDPVIKNREKHIRAVYFNAFKDQTQFSAHCKHANQVLNHRRLSVAVNCLHVWTMERKRRRDGIHRIRQMGQTRLLRQVWLTGWIRVHRAAKHHCLALKVRYFAVWKQFQRTRQAYYLQEEYAQSLHCKFCCKQTFEGWKSYYKLRLEHAQQLVKAQEHYRRYLLQRGVVNLWGAVYQNAQNSLQGHYLRRKMRVSLKKRYFCAWHSLMQSRKILSQKMQNLQRSRGYQKSIFNPSRWVWNRWIIFVSVCRQRHRCDRIFRLRIKRLVLFKWRRHAKIEFYLREFDFRGRRRVIRFFFGYWKSRVEKWKKVGVICELAEKVYERRLCTRVIRDWQCRSRYDHHVRLCGESIRNCRDAKLQRIFFLNWREKFDVRQCISGFKRGRERLLQQTCFTNWSRQSVQQKALTRKLTYFQQVYGKYPTSSIVSRAWRRWQHTCNQIRHMKVLRRKHQLRQARRCWSHWKCFHVACCIFRAWRKIARTISRTSNRLGMRLRCFRESRHNRLQRCTLHKWKRLIERSRASHEQQSLWKHRLNRELEEYRWRWELAARFHLSSWFRRWLVAQIKGSNLARNHFRICLLSKMILSWWKTTILSKQEKVLVEAQQAMGKLSYYHPQQQIYAIRARHTNNQNKEKRKLHKRTQKAKVTPKDVAISRAESMQKMRRMLDPTEYASYSRFYQDSSKEVFTNKPCNGSSKPLRSKVHFGHPVSDLKPRRQIDNGRSPRVEKKHQIDLEHCDRNDPDDGGVEEETNRSKPIVNSTSFCDISRDTSKNVPQQEHLPATSNQVSFEPQSGFPGGEFQEHFRRNCLLVSSEFSSQSQTSHPKIFENELLLFDDEITKTRDGKPTKQTERVVATKRRVRFSQDLQSQQTANNLVHAEPACVDQNDSFVPSRSTSKPGLEDRERNPQTLNIVSRKRECEVQGESNSNPVVINTSLSLAPVSDSGRVDRQHIPRVIKTRKTTNKNHVKVVKSTSNEARSLADILKLSDVADTNLPGYNEVNTATKRNDGRPWDASVIKDIVTFYPDNVVAHTTANEEQKQTRIHVCFRMARDLALLQNDFYIDELQKVYDTNFKDKDVEMPRSVVDKHDEQMKLEHFLEQLVESHPAYRKYVDRCVRHNPSVLLCASNWLAQHHLRPHIALQKRARPHPRKTKTYWVWEPIPADMDMALEILLPAITKYMGVLGQFFQRQAVRSSSTTDKPRDYRISSTAFISLMKQVRVFPQLFHRRELENAVRLSSCSSPETEEMNFPEFIEALVRCSCNLRWGELDASKNASEANNADTVVVIKFVMLIFAMEGQGSVLKKRNEDVSAILGFLGQQKKKKQAEKLFRFRKMLVDNKRRNRASRNHQLPSVWNQVRLHFSPMNSPMKSPTRSHDTFDELTGSWDGGSPRRNSTESYVFDAQTNQPFDLDAPPSPCVDTIDHQSEQQSTECGKREHDRKNSSVDDTSFRSQLSSESLPPMLAVDTSGNVDCHSETATQQEESNERNSVTTALHESNASLTSVQEHDRFATATSMECTVNSGQVHQFTTPTQATGLVAPMEKDEFLREIMDSIGDVELMLSQPRFTGSNYSKNGKRHPRGIPTSSSGDSAFLVDSVGCVPSLSELAGDSLVHDWQYQHDDTFSDNTDVDSEIQIRDPMLSYLTDIERFTESTGTWQNNSHVFAGPSTLTARSASDNTSLVAIAGMAAFPFTLASAPQGHISEPDAWASQEIRPTEATSSQTSTHESNKHENTIK